MKSSNRSSSSKETETKSKLKTATKADEKTASKLEPRLDPIQPNLKKGSLTVSSTKKPLVTFKEREEIDYDKIEAMSDEELALAEAATADRIASKLTKAEIDRQLDFQKEAMIHIDSLYNFAVRMTGDSEDANDLVQETYMKAYRFFDSFEKGTNCKAWLFRILKNSFINRYRKESKEPNKVDYDDIKEFYHTVKHSSLDSNDMQEQVFGGLLDDEVSRALDSLPEDFREVVQLCDIEGFTYEEIANMVDCPIGTVRSRLHRGRKILRDKLIEYAQQHGYKINPTEWED